MRFKKILVVILLFGIAFTLGSCFDKAKYAPRPYLRPLEIVKLSDKEYLHISYLKDNVGGYIPCNGYIRLEGKEAAIFDTPLNDSISQQLIEYVQEDLNAEIKAVVVSHFHIDAAGGLNAFKTAGIPSYGSEYTAAKLKTDSITIENVIKDVETFSIGNLKVENRFFGPAHSQGDIFSYIPNDATLLGGCAIKTLDAKKGNLKDASPDEWSATIQKVKEAYPNARLVIPGHGATGDGSLLDYTAALFAKDTLPTAVGN